MDLQFANESNHRLIQQLYPIHQFQIETTTFNARNAQLFSLSLEKLENIIQIRISDVANQNKIFLCTIGECLSNHKRRSNVIACRSCRVPGNQGRTVAASELSRIHRSLHHDSRFLSQRRAVSASILGLSRQSPTISYLLRFISLVQSQHGYVLQFYEKRSLKNLIHLFLRVQEAPPTIVMYHLSLSLSNLKDQVSTANNQTKYLENEVNKRDFHVQELQKEVDALKAKVAENENMVLHRNTEEIKRLNREIKSIETSKEFEENRLKTLVKTYEAKVDQLQQENFMANEKLL